MSGYTIKIMGLVAFPDRHTPWDNQYVLQYDPGLGQPGEALLNTVPAQADAKVYPDLQTAMNERQRVDPRAPWRWDGKPNCPLSAFNLSFDPAP